MSIKKLMRSSVYVIFFCTVIAFSCLYWRDDAEPSHPLPERNNASAVIDNVSIVVPPEATKVKASQPANHHLNKLQSLPNQQIIGAIQKFWKNCQATHSCDNQLKRIKETVSADRYSLISEYPEKLRIFNETIQYELTAEDWALEQKVDEVKAAYASVWGALSEELFFEELSFYDQRLALNTLYRDSQALTLDGKLQVFDDWVQGRSSSDGNNQDAYNAAKLFLEQELESQQGYALAAELAEKYLTVEQATKEKQRLDRRQFQAGQAQNYQKALTELRQTLMAERKGVYRDLSDADWLEHKEAEVRKFKVQFFE